MARSATHGATKKGEVVHCPHLLECWVHSKCRQSSSLCLAGQDLSKIYYSNNYFGALCKVTSTFVHNLLWCIVILISSLVHRLQTYRQVSMYLNLVHQIR